MENNLSATIQNYADYVCIGKIIRAHGIKGAIVFESYTQKKEHFLLYKRLWMRKNNESNFHPVKIHLLHRHKHHFVIALENVINRTDAEALKGNLLWMERCHLPNIENEDEWYYTDLIGLNVYNQHNKTIGEITNVVDFGAGNLLEIQPNTKAKKTFFVPFYKKFVPEINQSEKYIQIDESFFLEYITEPKT